MWNDVVPVGPTLLGKKTSELARDFCRRGELGGGAGIPAGTRQTPPTKATWPELATKKRDRAARVTTPSGDVSKIKPSA
jgi:hypothetical protein